MYQKKEEEFFKEFKDRIVSADIIRLTGAILGVEEMTKKTGKESTNMCELWEEVKIREFNKGEQQGYQKAKKELEQKDYQITNMILKMIERGFTKEEVIDCGFNEEDVLNILKS